MEIDSVTKTWIRNKSDELAAMNGCQFDPERGQHVIDFAEKYLRLYEGEYAGEPLIPHDWQIDATMRLFGWIKWSERWNRWVRRFTRASIWIPKKNKKSPTLAWWGLYLLCADGEMGQKVYFGAKEGSQARDIAGKHAMEMVLSSPELSAECKINLTSFEIAHKPTKSSLKPISGNDSRTQKSKEGLNGSLLIDETHVVDAAFINRVSRLGISRSEPLHIETSTAGNDPTSYGKTQFDKGLMIERGDIEEESFFFFSHHAPQDLSDEDLAKDPIGYGKMANPAWGHTIGEEEYLADYNRSRHSLSELAEFKMYRLNIWQRSSNPWLRGSDWNRCGEDYGIERFKDQRAWMSLDKSTSKDMTAVTLVFRGEDETYYQLPFFWLPRATAEKNKHLAPFMEWGEKGYLKLIDGEVIESRWIKQKVAELSKIVRIQNVHYDRAYAGDITLEFQEDLGIERVEFNQNAVSMTSPIDEYERLVILGKLKHPNNPVLTWQAGHCQVRNRPDGLRTLHKPQTPGDIKKIDGMQTGVMALFGAMHATPEYKRPSRLFISV